MTIWALAMEQGALRAGMTRRARKLARMWELRAATRPARRWHGQARASVARDLLASSYRRFTEGFDTRDLKKPKAC